MAPNTRAASAASREFLQPKVDRIDDLAEAARAINAAVQARAAADRNITECQQGVRPPSARGNRGRGWTEDELDQLGWASERGPQSQRRRGPTASGRPAQSPAAAAPESGPAAAGATATRPRPSRSSGTPGPTRALRRALIPTVPDVTRRAPTKRRRWAPARDRIRLRSNIGSGHADRDRLAGLTGLDRGGRA